MLKNKNKAWGLLLMMLLGFLLPFTQFFTQTAKAADAPTSVAFGPNQTTIVATFPTETVVFQQNSNGVFQGRVGGDPSCLSRFTNVQAASDGSGTATLEILTTSAPQVPCSVSQTFANLTLGVYDPANPDGTTTDETAATAPSCEERLANDGFGWGWLVCGLLNGVGSAVQGIFNWILDINEESDQTSYCNLEVNLDTTAGVSDPTSSCTSFDSTQLRMTWDAFRVLANAFFVLAFLYAIYQVAFSSGNNAYQIRSMLPRLAAAVVLVQLSFFLSKLLIDVSNDLGRYVTEVFNWVFGTDQFSVGGIIAGPDNSTFADFVIQSTVAIGLVVAIVVSATTILTAIVVMLITVYFVLVARKLLILMAIVLAPIAAITWIHPQTDGFSKAWWQTFSKLLLMYPMIILLLKSGELMARAVSGSTQAGTAENATFNLVALVAYFAPFFLIPFTFRFAGGLIGQISGAVNDRSKGLIDRARGVDERRQNERRNKALARYKANRATGKRTGPLTRARAGILTSSLLYGPKGGKLFRAEKSAEALNPDDRIRLAGLKGEEQDVKVQSFDIQRSLKETGDIDPGTGQPEKGTLLDEMFNPDTSYARRAAITEAMINRRDIPQLGKALDAMAKNGQVEDVSRLVQRNIGDLQTIAPQYGAGLLAPGTVIKGEGIKPDWSAVTDKPYEEIGSVHKKTFGLLKDYAGTEKGRAEAGQLMTDYMTRYVQAKRTNKKLDTNVSSQLAQIAQTGRFQTKDGQVVDVREELTRFMNPQILEEAKNLDDKYSGPAGAEFTEFKPSPRTTEASSRAGTISGPEGLSADTPSTTSELRIPDAPETLGADDVTPNPEAPARRGALGSRRINIPPAKSEIIATASGSGQINKQESERIYNDISANFGGAPTTAEIAQTRGVPPPTQPTRYDYVHERLSSDLGRRPTPEEMQDRWGEFAGEFPGDNPPTTSPGDTINPDDGN